MTPAYSLWLMPCAADAAELRALVDQLAPEFGEPAFLPHVTVQGDLEMPLQALAEHARALAATTPVQAWPVSAVERSAHFFRCLYLRFERQPAFDALQVASEDFAGTATGLSPYPHLSLAYGQVRPHQLALVDALQARFAGRTLVFDHFSVCESSKDLPIAEWQCQVDVPLSRPGHAG